MSKFLSKFHVVILSAVTTKKNLVAQVAHQKVFSVQSWRDWRDGLFFRYDQKFLIEKSTPEIASNSANRAKSRTARIAGKNVAAVSRSRFERYESFEFASIQIPNSAILLGVHSELSKARQSPRCSGFVWS